MNYIKQLQQQVADRGKVIAAYKAAEHDLRCYLLSSKFHDDPTVQVRDVLLRLEQGYDFHLNNPED